MTNNISKPRKVYLRQNVLHICWKGKLFAPVDSLSSRMCHGEAVTAEFYASEIEGRRTKVRVRSERAGVANELWVETVIPTKKEQKAAAEAALIAEQEEAIAKKIADAKARPKEDIGSGLNILDFGDDEELEPEVA